MRRFWCRTATALALLVGTIATAGSVAHAAPSRPHASIEALPGWGDDTLAGWLQAWQRSCQRRPWSKAKAHSVDSQAWQTACSAARGLKTVSTDWVARYFHVKHIEPSAFVTGYFEPIVAGARHRGPRHQVPLYAKPADPQLAQLSRAAIDAGGLAGQGLELAWLADPVDAYFLHIQGSGQVRFADGTSLHVGYGGNNGQVYRAIGRDLVAMGAIARSAVSMQTIAAWLHLHPREAVSVMHKNARYIYFRSIPGDGPLGAQGVALTPERSIAVDPQQIPYGLPVWLDLDHPDTAARHRLQTLTVAQDTGSAIRGAGRADLFWGAGERAAILAGRMQSRGRLYVLWPRRPSP
jgi:membrane-bound lytic murein transglycosylase A